MKKKFLLLILTAFIILFCTTNLSIAKTYNRTLSTGQLQEISKTLDTFTMKIYTKSLFSPEENEALISIKFKLDNQLMYKKDSSLAPLYYKAGNVYKAREYKAEAIECYQTIIDNYGNTPYAQKAKKELLSLGAKVKQ